MKKLEKSVRSCMKPYGPDLRNGHIVVQGKIPGHILEDGVDRMLDHAYADVENGVVTDIRMYFEQEHRLARDYEGNSLEITGEIEDWFGNHETWDDLIQRIVRTVEEYLRGDQDDNVMSPAAIRAATGLNKKEFAARYKIPYRSWQNWELGVNPFPEYIQLLLSRVVQADFGE